MGFFYDLAFCAMRFRILLNETGVMPSTLAIYLSGTLLVKLGLDSKKCR